MADMRNPPPGATGDGRVVVGLRNGANTTQNGSKAQRLVAVIRKNTFEEIRVELSEFNGHDLLNVRVWAEPRNGGTERIPTKAGIACNIRLLPELIEALRKAEAEARSRGSL